MKRRRGRKKERVWGEGGETEVHKGVNTREEAELGASEYANDKGH